jgi:hypothetical protein
MRAASEIYKGIEFVRIFTLPDEQKVLLWQTLSRDKIIKILKDEVLLNDCVQYTDYCAWYDTHFKSEPVAVQEKRTVPNNPVLIPVLK